VLLKHKFSKSNVELLKMALLDYYNTEALSGAKVRLTNDIAALNSLVKLTYVPHRRDGENRLTHEADDLVMLFTALDENKLISSLPRYVADGLDSMPPIRLYDGELNGVLMLIKKLLDQVDEYASALAEVTNELCLLQAKCSLPPALSTIKHRHVGPITDSLQLRPNVYNHCQRVNQLFFGLIMATS